MIRGGAVWFKITLAKKIPKGLIPHQRDTRFARSATREALADSGNLGLEDLTPLVLS